MTLSQTLALVGLTTIPTVSLIVYFLMKKKEELRVKIPVRIHENDRRYNRR